MANVDSTKRRKTSPHRSEFQEARPLLQAILLGVALATALVAAAAMATPEAERQSETEQNPIILEAEPLTGSKQGTHAP